MFKMRLATMVITTVTIVTIGSATALQREREAGDRRMHLQNGRILIDDKVVHHGFNINKDHFRYLYFYVPARGLFIVSDSQFDGATEAGGFNGRALSFRVDGSNVRVEGSTRILSDSAASAWVKFDPAFTLDVKSVMLGYGDKESTPYEWPNQLREAQR